MSKLRVGLLTSAWDDAAVELVRRVHEDVRDGWIPNTKIAFVFVSREEGETTFGDLMIEAVREMGLPLITFSSLQFEPELRAKDIKEWRKRHDREVMSLLPPTDLDVLLGYMWVVGQGMCWLRNMINLHPALPGGPTGTYRDVIWELIRNRATESGVMMHLVTPELDRGPSISYCRYPIRGAGLDRAWQQMEMRLSREGGLDSIKAAEGEENLLFSLIREKGVARELPLITETIKLFAEQQIFVVMDKWVFSKEDGLLEDGYDLTETIDLVVGGGKVANGH